MTRALGIAVFAFCASVGPVWADEAPVVPVDVQKAADAANVDPVSLYGAMLTTGLDAATYLCQADGYGCPKPVAQKATVRLTYYTLTGLTFSGIKLYIGSTACSWNFPIGQRFRFSDGETVTCIDRGQLGQVGWLDLWNQPALAHKYGPYALVEVL